MQRMIALKRIPSYFGRAFEAGQEFEVEDKDVAFFVKIGHAKPVKDVEVTVKRGRKKQTYRTRMLTAESA